MRRSFWQRFFDSQVTRNRQSRSPRHRTSFRPGLESLEELVLLSGMTFVPTDVRILNSLLNNQTVFGSPWGLTPAQVRHAYGFDQIMFQNGTVVGNGAGETIAIVDAYDDPSIANDLAVFDQQFGLPRPGRASSRSASMATMRPPPRASRRPTRAGPARSSSTWNGRTPWPPAPRSCSSRPTARPATDLLNAIDYARRQSGVVAVSMSWGAGRVCRRADVRQLLHHPGRARWGDLLRLIRRQRLAEHLAGPVVQRRRRGRHLAQRRCRGRLSRRNGLERQRRRPQRRRSGARLPAGADRSTTATASSPPTAGGPAPTWPSTPTPTRAWRCTAATAGAAGPRWAAPAPRRRSGPP